MATRRPFPEHGQPTPEILDALKAKRVRDARWDQGRTFGLVFDGGPDVHEVAEAVAAMFLHDNALNPAAFPSLAEIQAEVVDACLDLFHAPDGARGYMTSGGTESVLMAVKTARDWGRAERGVTEPHMVLAASAHAAFHKAAHYFGVEATTVPVGADWRADVDAMRAAVRPSTVLVVGSAPQYPQGVVDPIPELAELAAAAGALCHVDACMGGFVLPFMERLGLGVPPWDFRVPGVSTVSADLHKLGYAPKGASVILHRSKDTSRRQAFLFDGWLGGLYGSPAMQGTRPGLPMACAWAVLHRLGADGYLRLTEVVVDAAARLRAGINAVDGLRVLGSPTAHLHAFTSTDDDVDVLAVGAGLRARGWHQDDQAPPPSLHQTVSAGNAPVVDEYLADLAASLDEARRSGAAGAPGAYAAVD
jgi:sphinganine-1-phosphate aldolase